jgi:DNA-binding NarL/FixJ family response regulator
MSGALAKVRAEKDSSGTIRRAVDQAVRDVARAIVEETEGVRALPGALVRTVRARDAVYHVRGSLLDSRPGLAAESPPAVVVVIERAPAEAPPAEDIRKALGLTRKQAIVARLLAAGLTNTQIADRLSISRHTARHHTESIMARLGRRTRAGVAETVLGAGFDA